ncbi:MAG: hypothetical protein QOE83_106 [Actinomycetota bacterium]|jgi:hypothetical protein|nr:hypothetical protein [Actinomycetota bacterium]
MESRDEAVGSPSSGRGLAWLRTTAALVFTGITGGITVSQIFIINPAGEPVSLAWVLGALAVAGPGLVAVWVFVIRVRRTRSSIIGSALMGVSPLWLLLGPNEFTKPLDMFAIGPWFLAVLAWVVTGVSLSYEKSADEVPAAPVNR